MPTLKRKLPTLALAVLALLGSPATSAQDARWFRVEVLIFTNEAGTTPAGAAGAEQFDATPTLVYPAASRFLIDPAQVAGNNEEFGGTSHIDDYGRQIITILTEPLPGVGVPAAGSGQAAPAATAQNQAPAPLKPVYSEPVPGAPAENPGPAPLSPVYSGPAPAVAPSQLPRPFVILPQGYQEFRGKAALMQRGGRHSILFHQTWVQPVGDQASSLPIVLDRSGDSQQWPRLQGTINLYLSRYLQVQTNLWLNTAGEYLPGNWQMPAPPFGPPSLVIEEEQMVDIAAAIEDLPAGIGPGSGKQTEPAGDTADEALPATAVETATITPEAQPGTVAEGNETGLEAGVPEPAGPAYPYRHAVLLDQTRRMRSGEVHYVDHPMLGMIVKFTPVTTEQLTTIAQEQAGSLPENQAP